MSPTELSPINLLLQHRDRDDTALDDALILTYNHDLAFFEREALGLLQLTGARLAVIGDATATGHDFYAVHRAGIAYLPGLALCSGAFHPKLLVLVSSDEATVSVGSGNLTLSGWRGNDELWSIHRATTEGGSTVPRQVGDFLSLLPGIVNLVPSVADVLRRVGTTLSTFPGDDGEHRLVSSLTEPIIEQLPRGPVDELLLYAPFHDEAATAVRQLIERFQPAVVRVAFQPESTLIDGAKVAALLGADGEIYPISNSPYRHGKLVEWRIGDQRWALTGSPNLSAAALLRTPRSGGNVELGVVSPIAESLMPDRVDESDDVVPLPKFERRLNKSGASDVVLAAVAGDDGLTITLARPLSSPSNVEHSLPNEPPERWTVGGALPAGEREYHLDIHLPGGTRVRLVGDDGVPTSTVFVANLSAINRVRAARRLGPRAPEIVDVLTDPDTAERFWSILRAESNRVTAPRGLRTPGKTTATDADRSTTMGDWSAYLDRCRGQLGTSLLAFALGLPDLATRPTPEHHVIDWDVDEPFNDEVGALEEDAPDTELPEENPESIESIKARLSEALRTKYRTFAQRRAAETTTTEPHETLVALRLVLLLAAGEVWGTADLTWAELVLQAVVALDRCEGEELEAASGSLGALALAIVDHAYTISPSKVDRAGFRKAVQAVSHLLIAADADRINEYGKGLKHFGSCIVPSAVLDLRNLLVNDDPLELSLKALDDAGVDYRQRGSLLLLDKKQSNPLLHARDVSAIVGRLDNVAIRAAGKTAGQWAAVVRSGQDSIEIRTGTVPRTVLVTHRRQLGGRWVDVAETYAKQPVPAETTDVLSRLSLSIDDLHDL